MTNDLKNDFAEIPIEDLYDSENPLVPGRTCGSCMLCCTVMQVEELNKPSGVKCSYAVTGRGCNTQRIQLPGGTGTRLFHQHVAACLDSRQRESRQTTMIGGDDGEIRVPCNGIIWGVGNVHVARVRVSDNTGTRGVHVVHGPQAHRCRERCNTLGAQGTAAQEGNVDQSAV